MRRGRDPRWGGARAVRPAGRPAGAGGDILGSSMVFIDGTAVNVALPSLQANLGATAAGVQGSEFEAGRDRMHKPIPRIRETAEALRQRRKQERHRLKQQRLLIQRCRDCGVLRHPPQPMCGQCRRHT